MVIKKWDGNAWVAQSPKVSYADVMVNFGQVGSEVTAFPNGKLRESLLPDSVFSGLTFVGTVAAVSPSSPFELKRFITGTATGGYTLSSTLDALTGNDYSLGEYAGVGQRYIGYYWVMATNVSIFDATSSTPEASWDTAVFDEGVTPALVGGLFADNIDLETGDWVIITGWDNSTSTFRFRVISNNLRQASATETGTIKLGSNTTQTVAANAVTATTGRSYAVQLNSSGQAVVNVGWTDTNTTYTADGTSILLSGTQFSHADTSTQASVNNSGRTYIQDITLDTYGHITGITSATETVTDTTYSAGNGISLSSTTFSVAAGVGLTQEASGLKMSQPHIAGTATPSASYQVTDTLWFDTN